MASTSRSTVIRIDNFVVRKLNGETYIETISRYKSKYPNVIVEELPCIYSGSHKEDIILLAKIISGSVKYEELFLS